jgi:MFS family permease
MVERWSARKWICRIMVSWGLMAALTAFVTTPKEFYTVRFLLGLAEAGCEIVRITAQTKIYAANL